MGLCAKLNKKATVYWLEKINKLNIDDIMNVFARVPKDLISEISIEFALRMLKENKKRLLKLKEELDNE